MQTTPSTNGAPVHTFSRTEDHTWNYGIYTCWYKLLFLRPLFLLKAMRVLPWSWLNKWSRLSACAAINPRQNPAVTFWWTRVGLHKQNGSRLLLQLVSKFTLRSVSGHKLKVDGPPCPCGLAPQGYPSTPSYCPTRGQGTFCSPYGSAISDVMGEAYKWQDGSYSLSFFFFFLIFLIVLDQRQNLHPS